MSNESVEYIVETVVEDLGLDAEDAIEVLALAIEKIADENGISPFAAADQVSDLLLA